MIDLEKALAKAVRHFWQTRADQLARQGVSSGRKDAGSRGAVTGGKHADGFVRLIAAIVSDAGLADASIHIAEKAPRTLPGFFRPTKEWDVVVIAGNDLIAAIEVKSQVGSFGNNFNNRVEEALGNATDFWTAYREGMFSPSRRPWLGYFFMLEEHPASLRQTKRIALQPFGVDESFQEQSYVGRYEKVCLRLVRERLYDAACFFTSSPEGGLRGKYSQPCAELSIRNFAISLQAHVAAAARLK